MFFGGCKNQNVRNIAVFNSFTHSTISMETGEYYRCTHKNQNLEMNFNDKRSWNKHTTHNDMKNRIYYNIYFRG